MSSIEAPAAGRGSAERRAWSDNSLSARARAIWNGADFTAIAKSFAEGAAQFVTRLKLKPGETVLDVACGTGNLAIPAAWAGARVVGVDIAPRLIARAQEEARGLSNVEFDVGDAEALPYMDARFATTITMFGAMFAYRQEQAASELVRVTRRGGRIAMANWTPEGFVEQLLRAHTAVVPPPDGIPSPLNWGIPEKVRALLGDGVTALSCTRRTLEFRFPYGPAAVSETFATSYGPTVAALLKTDAAGTRTLRESITRLFSEANVATDGTTVVVAEYLDVEARVV